MKLPGFFFAPLIQGDSMHINNLFNSGNEGERSALCVYSCFNIRRTEFLLIANNELFFDVSFTLPPISFYSTQRHRVSQSFTEIFYFNLMTLCDSVRLCATL